MCARGDDECAHCRQRDDRGEDDGEDGPASAFAVEQCVDAHRQIRDVARGKRSGRGYQSGLGKSGFGKGAGDDLAVAHGTDSRVIRPRLGSAAAASSVS